MKKLLSILLSVSLLCAPAAACAEDAGHGDAYAPSEWALSDIGEADALGIIPDGFTSEWVKPITRGEFCALAYNALNTAGLITEIQHKNPFKDTDSSEIIYLNALGIINGRAADEFAPDALLTREEAAVILDRVLSKLGAPDNAVQDWAYTDDAEISDWAKNGVYKMGNMKIMNGTDKGFEPKAPYTAEQSVVTLMRALRLTAQYRVTATAVPEKSPEMFTDRINALMPDSENYMFSPLSVQMALALAANGADGETKSEILSAVDISDLDSFNKASKEKIEKYTKADVLQLNVANSIWLNKSRTDSRFSDSYKTTLDEYYGATADIVDDSTAVDTINKWVGEKTNGKIPTIINSSDFWSMLVNAVYFKGAWENEFMEGATQKDTFHNADGSTAETDFMHDTGWYSYCNEGGAQIIELPYRNITEKISENGDFLEFESYDDLDISMYVILSDNAVNPQSLILAAKVANKPERTYVNLSIPKFEFDYSTSLNDILKQLGIKRAFEENAEFSKMLDSGNMQITDTIHKTYIKVDERGTEAAAVTGIGMAGSALPPEPIEFKADKPFEFVIMDNTDGSVLFAGRAANFE